MTAAELIREIGRLGGAIRTENGRLVVSAAAGALPPTIVREIRERRNELLRILDRVRGGALGREPIPRVDRANGSPLGLTQERFWYLGSLSPESAIYNLPAAFRLRGPLDVGALRWALDEIVRRHEALRTSVRMIDDGPVLVVGDEAKLDLPLVDLTGAGGGATEAVAGAHPDATAEAMARIEVEKDEPIDISKAPLARARLYRIAPNEHLLFWMPHHLVWDGWSFDIFLGELDALYGARCEGRESPLPPPGVQYPDYAAWHRKAVSGRAREEHLAYWRPSLATPVPPLEVPTDRPRPEMLSYEGARATFELDPRLVAALTELGRREGATLYMILLGAFYALLHRYTGQSDLAVGTPIQARDDPRTADALGVFVNTLVLRTTVEGEASFTDLLARVRDLCVGAYAHQDTPFELLVEEFQAARVMNRTPLYQALFSYQDVRNRGDRVGPLQVDQLHVETSFAPTELTVWAMLTADGLTGGVDYLTALFDRATVQRMLEHYVALLRAIVADPSTPVERLAILSPAERARRIEEAWGERTSVPAGRVDERVAAGARNHPNAVAVEWRDESLTYAELDQRAGAVATWLRSAGVRPGDLVGVHLPRSTDLVATLIGIWKAGAAYLPLDPEHPEARLRAILADAGAVLVVTHPGAEGGPLLESRTIPLLGAPIGVPTESPGEPAVAGGTGRDLAYVMYTSGSTGTPKGVEIEHGAVMNVLESLRRTVDFRPRDSLLAVTTYAFDISVLEMFLPLIAGGRVRLASGSDLRDGFALAAVIDATRPSVVQATPSTWRLLRDAGWAGRPEGVRVLCGGEELTPGLAAWLRTRCSRLFNVYGPTETTIWSSVHEVTEDAPRVPIGRPVANTGLYVLDGTLEPLPPGIAGELFIAGAGVARGYRGRPDLTAERFVPDPFGLEGTVMYRTGDRARVLADGSLEFLGRSDRQVQVRGHRVELGEVEAAIREVTGIQDAVVRASALDDGDLRLQAFIVPTAGASVTPTDVRQALRRRLPAYMVPGVILALDRLPLSANGKVDYRRLPDPLRAGGTATDARVAPPETERERLVAEVWKELLGATNVGKGDNFFDLGGHSLLSMRAVAAVERRTGTRLDPRLMFFHTLEQIAASLPESVEERVATAS